jgi:hypothetical protein
MKIFSLIPILLLFFSCKEDNDTELNCFKQAFEIEHLKNSSAIGDKYQICNQGVRLSFINTKKEGYEFVFSKNTMSETYPFWGKEKMIFTTKIRKETWDKVDSIFRDINFWCLDSSQQQRDFERNKDLYILRSEYLRESQTVNITIDSSASIKSKTYKLWSFLKLVNVRQPKIIEVVEGNGTIFKVISQNEIATFKVLVDGVEAKKIEECTAIFKTNKKVDLTCYETYSNDDTFIYKKEIEPYIQNQ